MDEDLIKKVDIEKLADEGEKIYEEVKSKYEPQDVGKYLAIEVESKDVFLAENTADAVLAAKKVYPDKMFFVVKIGYSANEILSNMKNNPW
jgi:hypothetical protein